MFKLLKFFIKTSVLSILVLCLILFSFSLANLYPTVSALSPNISDTADLETFMEQTIQSQMKKHHIPNLTIAVVYNGQVVLQRGYGFANIDNQTSVDPESTLFRIGSTSKLLTWTAVMQLVEQGKLDLNADINNYLDFEIPDNLIKAAGAPNPAPITLTHLMTHTPGFEDYPDYLFRTSKDQIPPLAEYLKTYLPARIFPAGQVSAYSNYGTALAGYIVERVSGMDFSDYIEQNIFAPLEMSNSTFRQPLPGNLDTNMTQAYRFVDGKYLEGGFEYIMMEPAGSMSTTASDMAKFMIAHLQGGVYKEERVLKQETIKQMHSQHFTQHQDLGGMALGFMEGVYNGHKVLFHGGGTMIFDTGLYLMPEQNAGIFVSYSGGSYVVHSEIFHQFVDRYYPSTSNDDILPSEGGSQRSQKLAGEYHMNRRSLTTAEKFNSLMMGSIKIDTNKDGSLMVTYGGEKYTFVEKEPGIYKNIDPDNIPYYFGSFKTLVLDTDPFARIMLAFDGPMTYSKAPWYGSSSFTYGALGFSVLVIMGSLIYWMISSLINIIRRKRFRHSKAEMAATWTAASFSIITLIMLIGILSTGQMDPVYLLPMAAFGVVSLLAPIMNILPIILALLTITIIVFTVTAWIKGYWRTIGRIHYTAYAMASLLLIFVFKYWNLL